MVSEGFHWRFVDLKGRSTNGFLSWKLKVIMPD
jgi:hypothetical protein